METFRIAVITETLPLAQVKVQPWRYLYDLARALRAEGHEAFMVSGDRARGSWDGVPVEHHGDRSDFRSGRGLRRILRDHTADLGIFRLTATLFFSMRRPQPDDSSRGRLAGIFLRPLHSGRDLARRFLDPVLAPEIRSDVHHAGLYASRRLGTWPDARSFVDRFFFLWESDRLSAISAGLPTTSCAVVRHPFDPFFLTRESASLGPRLSEALTPVGRRVVFAGPDEPSRGVPDLFRLARALPPDPPTQVLLLLRDPGVAEPTISEAHHGPHTTLVVRGLVSREELRAVYMHSDVAVFPYRFVRTGLPLVLLEAVAAGLPVVSTRVHPIREYEGTTGLVFAKPRNPADLAIAIERALDAGHRDELLRTNRAWIASTPGWPEVARTFVSVMKDLPPAG